MQHAVHAWTVHIYINKSATASVDGVRMMVREDGYRCLCTSMQLWVSKRVIRCWVSCTRHSTESVWSVCVEMVWSLLLVE